MHVSELYHLTKWIDREIKENEILGRYQTLQSVLHGNSRPNQAKQPFESQKDDLIGAISVVPLESLSTEQVDFLRKLGIGDYVGEDAVKRVEDILFRNAIDSATADQKFAQIVEQFQAGIERSHRLQQSLDGIVPEEPELKDRVLVRVTFSNQAAIANVVDLRNWSNIWYDIGRGVAMINDSSPEQVEVVGADKGSVVIELAVAYGIAKTISAVILEALKVAEKVLDIRKKAEDLRGMKLTNTKIAKELEDEAQKERKKGIDRITDKVSKHKRKKNTSEGDKVNALDRAVKHLVDFIEKGGEVDCVLPTEAPEDGGQEAKPEPREVRELRATFSEIRHLEIHLKQLEDAKEPRQEDTLA